MESGRATDPERGEFFGAPPERGIQSAPESGSGIWHEHHTTVFFTLGYVVSIVLMCCCVSSWMVVEGTRGGREEEERKKGECRG